MAADEIHFQGSCWCSVAIASIKVPFSFEGRSSSLDVVEVRDLVEAKVVKVVVVGMAASSAVPQTTGHEIAPREVVVGANGNPSALHVQGRVMHCSVWQGH